MIKQRGFTLIEVIIALVIVFIVVTMVTNGIAAMKGNSTISFGINGMTEIRCIDGYEFIVSQEGSVRQVLDEFGKGARCVN